MSRGLTILTEIWADIGTRYPLLRNKVFLRNYALSMFMEKSCYGRIRNAPDPYMDVLIKYRRHRAYKAGPCSEELRFGCCYGAIIQYLTRTSREGSGEVLGYGRSLIFQNFYAHRHNNYCGPIELDIYSAKEEIADKAAGIKRDNYRIACVIQAVLH